MPYEGIDTLRSQRQGLLQKLADVDRRIDRLESLPAEPNIGATVVFDKGQYFYAARRGSHGKWHTTGATCPRLGFTWEGLVAFAEGAAIHRVGHVAPIVPGR